MYVDFFFFCFFIIIVINYHYYYCYYTSHPRSNGGKAGQTRSLLWSRAAPVPWRWRGRPEDAEVAQMAAGWLPAWVWFLLGDSCHYFLGYGILQTEIHAPIELWCLGGWLWGFCLFSTGLGTLSWDGSERPPCAATRRCHRAALALK